MAVAKKKEKREECGYGIDYRLARTGQAADDRVTGMTMLCFFGWCLGRLYEGTQTSRGRQNCLCSKSGGGLWSTRRMGRNDWGGHRAKKPDKKLRQFFFLALAGQEKKRQQARELELFFLSPRILLARAPVTAAEVEGAKRQCPHRPLAVAATALRQARPTAETSKPPRLLARKWQERLLFAGTCSGVWRELVGRRLPETATMATISDSGEFFWIFFFFRRCHCHCRCLPLPPFTLGRGHSCPMR
ncbi:hypothetical protein V8C34DRAFT_207364 [Trichoderma compactum]